MYLKLFVKRFLFKRMFKIAHVFQLEMWITPKSLLFSGCSLFEEHPPGFPRGKGDVGARDPPLAWPELYHTCQRPDV
jgi:hypothetical protein